MTLGVGYLLVISSSPGCPVWTSCTVSIHHRHLRGHTIFSCLPYTQATSELMLWEEILHSPQMVSEL